MTNEYTPILKDLCTRLRECNFDDPNKYLIITMHLVVLSLEKILKMYPDNQKGEMCEEYLKVIQNSIRNHVMYDDLRSR